VSDVEAFWAKLQPHFPNWRPWSALNPIEQMQVVQGINIILGVL
jgi:hypothetical protein